jgi:outer membrane receptor protein involved in Fe transport
VWTYNIGAEWQPIKDLRFRGMYAKAVRAPNISELFSQPSQTFAGVTDPCDGVTATSAGAIATACRAIPAIAAAIAASPTQTFQYTLADTQRIDGLIGGNQNLDPETAKTKTLGAVFTPSFVPGLGITVDYYSIRVTDAISTLDRNFTMEQCLLTGSAVFCSNVFRDPNTGFVTRVNAQLINVAALENKGIDFGLTYGRALHILSDDRLNLSLNWTHLIDNKTQASPSDKPVDNAGTFGRGFSRDSAFLRSSYKFGIVTLGWQTNYLSGGPFLRNFFSPFRDPRVNALNDVKDYWTHDAQLRFDPQKNITVYFNVDNVFDKKPQLLPGVLFGTPTGLETAPDMDVFGRRFLAGVRVKFL